MTLLERHLGYFMSPLYVNCRPNDLRTTLYLLNHTPTARPDRLTDTYIDTYLGVFPQYKSVMNPYKVVLEFFRILVSNLST